MLRLDHIRLQLGRFRLRIDTFHVRPGEYRVLLGPTGTGKTVLLETIAGLHTPQQGRILLNGRDVTGTAPEERNLGVVYQEYALFPHLSVSDNIAFGLRMRRVRNRPRQKEVEKMASFLGISHLLARRPGRLSGGERQRVALARALVLRPDLLLLDEPLSALDRLTRDRLRRELQRVHRELGITILHITHDLDEAFFLADRMTVMQHGTLLQEGTPEAISCHPATRFVAGLMGRKNFIPARVAASGAIAVQGLGDLAPGLLVPPPLHPMEDLLLTFPSWAVELEPDPADHDLWWQGTARIRDVRGNDSQVEVELARGHSITIHATLSRREAGRLSPMPEPGREVRIGISREGLHWLPAGDE